MKNMSRTRPKEGESDTSNQSVHTSKFFESWPYKRTASSDPGKTQSNPPAKPAAGRTTVPKTSNQVNQSQDDRKIPDPENARIGNSTPTRPSFSPRASFFACSPILKDRQSLGVTIDDCRRIVDRISETLPRLRRSVSLRTSSCNRTSPARQADQETKVTGTTEKINQSEERADVVCDEDGGRTSRSCQTDPESDTWTTFEMSAGNDSLLLALDRLCHEFSSGRSSRAEYADAMRLILTPIVEEVVTELHLNGKLDMNVSQVASRSPDSHTK